MIRLSEQKLFKRIECIYDASLDPALWPSVIESLCQDFDAMCGVLQIREQTSLAPLISADAGVDPDGMKAYVEHFYQGDLWAQQIYRCKEGEVLLGQEVVAKDTFEKSEFLNDFLLRYAGPHALFGMTLRGRLDGNFTLISKQKPGGFRYRRGREFEFFVAAYLSGTQSWH